MQGLSSLPSLGSARSGPWLAINGGFFSNRIRRMALVLLKETGSAGSPEPILTVGAVGWRDPGSYPSSAGLRLEGNG